MMSAPSYARASPAWDFPLPLPRGAGSTRRTAAPTGLPGELRRSWLGRSVVQTNRRGGRMASHLDAVRGAVQAFNDQDRDRYVTYYRPEVALHGLPEGVVDAASLGEFYAA